MDKKPQPADLQQFLRSRRSIRKFSDTPVSVDTLQKIIETATFAPSAHNRQPWRFAVLTDSPPKEHLADAMGADFRRDLERDNLPEEEIARRLEHSRRRIVDSPIVIILCMDTSEMDSYPDPIRQTAERTMSIQSVANAGVLLQLAAHAEGLSSVWTCGPLFTQKIISEALELQKNWEPQAMFFIGYPADEPKEKQLKPITEIAKYL